MRLGRRVIYISKMNVWESDVLKHVEIKGKLCLCLSTLHPQEGVWISEGVTPFILT
jgi:hypothetical protein